MHNGRHPTLYATPDRARIAARLDALWGIAHGPGGGADRPAYSVAEAQAMRLVAGWAREAGLEPGLDDFGNLWALPVQASGPIVTSGSHVDTVPDGGRYDGALGTVLGLEAAAELGPDAGLLICAAEEAPRFGAGTMGSRQLVGTLSQQALDQLHDVDGVSAADARATYLQELADLPRIAPPLDRLRAHAEVHVAQRRSLRNLGVVSAVASPRRFAVRIEGEAGHSGEVSMADRRDALAAAAEVVLAVEAAARAEPDETVATVGTLTVQPGAVSVIPGRAELAIDVRGIASGSLARIESAVREAVDEIATRRAVTASIDLVRAGEPVTMDPGLVQAALQAAHERGIPAIETWSGAGHDAQHVTALVPALLLFVPLHGGESHTPQEDADMDEIVQAASVMAAVLGELALDSGSKV
ncbi:MAG TPA: hydantoinase/carbamoylase family amidase [Solirubrobacteraceae bacterium]|nr:hydantoinase/carbamoylase family amidase [Solirubrobacteraceae bacterium]